MKKNLLSSFVFLAVAASATTAGAADVELASAIGANGPGVGRGAAALGGGIFYAGGAVGPSIAFDYSRGLGERVDFQLHLDLGALIPSGGAVAGGVIQPGVLVRVTPRNPYVGLALKLSPELFFIGGGVSDLGAAGGVTFGGTPGAVLSLGNERFQISVGADVPMYFLFGGAVLGLGAGGGTGFLATVRPYAGIELAIADGVSLFAKAAPTFAIEDGASLMYVEAQAGFVF